jgi:CheY-like chemotaxis protein
VVGWTKILLARQVEPAMLNRALQVIDRNAVAQTRLIDDLLDMARIMSGKIPAIAVTAYGRPQDKRRALAAGFRMHIPKPVGPEALAAAVAAVLPPRDAR